MSIAYNLSAADKGPSAIAMVQGGLTIAIMLGVPFGSYLGATLSTLFLNNGASFKLITSIAAGMVLFGMILTMLTYKVENNKILNQQSG